MRALSSAHCTDVRLYTLRIKIGTTVINERSASSRIVELDSGFDIILTGDFNINYLKLLK